MSLNVSVSCKVPFKAWGVCSVFSLHFTPVDWHIKAFSTALFHTPSSVSLQLYSIPAPIKHHTACAPTCMNDIVYTE